MCDQVGPTPRPGAPPAHVQRVGRRSWADGGWDLYHVRRGWNLYTNVVQLPGRSYSVR